MKTKINMNKIKFATLGLAVLLASFLLLNGCGKSEKEESKNEKKQTQDILDTLGKSGVETFYTSSDGKYWQNYPGKAPGSDAEMTQIKDPAQVSRIKQDITGAGKETVYTCEMHPEIMQNYPGKCPKCKMDMIKLKDKNKIMHEKKHEDIESKWEGKPNAIHKEFRVPNAKCSECDKLIENVLTTDKGVLGVMADSENRTVHLYLDKTKTNLDNVEKLLLAAGFDVENKKGDPETSKSLPDCCK